MSDPAATQCQKLANMAAGCPDDGLSQLSDETKAAQQILETIK
jgi:hypothetical protein